MSVEFQFMRTVSSSHSSQTLERFGTVPVPKSNGEESVFRRLSICLATNLCKALPCWKQSQLYSLVKTDNLSEAKL